MPRTLAQVYFYLSLSLSLWLLSPLDLGRFSQFLIPIYSQYDSFNGGSACRKAASYTQTE
jgi:hypothetical protein